MTKITRIALALLFMLTATSIPAPVKAYTMIGGSPHEWPTATISWCIANRGGWTSWHLDNTVRTAFDHWDANMTKREINEFCPWVGRAGIQVHVVSFNAKGWPSNAARTETGISGGVMVRADIYINKDHTNKFYLSTSGRPTCTVPCNPQYIDFYTIVSHEIGHAIGLGENAGSGRNNLCSNGYGTESTAAACVEDYYSVDVMYWNAGVDGYRRWIQSDSRGGLVAMGYR